MSFLLDFVATKNGTRLAIYIYFSLQLTSHAQLLTEKSHFRKPPEGSFMFSYTEGTFCNMILWYESDWCHSLITHSPNKQSFNWRNFQVGHGIFFIWYLHTTNNATKNDHLSWVVILNPNSLKPKKYLPIHRIGWISPEYVQFVLLQLGQRWIISLRYVPTMHWRA